MNADDISEYLERVKKAEEVGMAYEPAPTTHHEHSARANNATPCTAADMTFGGRCLACGWDPEKVRQ